MDLEASSQIIKEKEEFYYKGYNIIYYFEIERGEGTLIVQLLH